MFDTATGWLMANMSRDPDGGVADPDRDQPAAVPVHHSRRGADRSRRFAAAADRRQSSRSSRFRRCSPARCRFGFASPELLLGATFLLGVGGALAAPAWVSIAPLLVPRRDLESADRGQHGRLQHQPRRRAGDRRPGDRLGRHFGAVLDLRARAMSAILAALFWWRPPRRVTSGLPAERLTTAIRTGLRHARNNRHLHATLVRTLAFFPFASAYWALLPLIARAQPRRARRSTACCSAPSASARSSARRRWGG